MSAQRGRLFLLKLGSSTSPTTFTTVAGLRNTSITINGDPIDVTTKDQQGWREIASGAGIRTMDISADGVFENEATIEAVRELAMLGTLNSFQIATGWGKFFEGQWVVTNFSLQANYNDSCMYNISLSNSGEVNYI